MKTALIDADIFCYSFGSMKDDEGNPLSWPFVASRLDAQLASIKDKTEAEETKLFITDSGGSNFRIDVATIQEYKGNRPTEKPHHYQRVRDYLVKFRKAEIVYGMEADDKLSIEQMKDYNDVQYSCTQQALGGHSYKEEYNTVICSIDKDLDMVPGWHYNWTKKDGEPYFINETTALQNFYCQLLTGDGVDNILGLFNVGRKSSLLHTCRSYTDERLMYGHVKEQYRKRFGSYAEKFMLENAQLLWMKRSTMYLGGDEIKERFDELEGNNIADDGEKYVNLERLVQEETTATG